MGHPLVLYDGVCGLCNRMVQIVLRHDHSAVFRFAPLQSALGCEVIARHGVASSQLDTFYVVVDDGGEVLLARSEAVLFVMKQLGGIWRLPGLALQTAPRGLRDWVYNIIACNRYRIFGRYDTCPKPTAATRDRFLDL